MTERVRSLHRLFLVAVATGSLAPAGVAREGRSGGRHRVVVVAVLALPDSMTEQATPDTQRLALEIAGSLRGAEIRAVVAGAPRAIPLEELVATANSRSTDLTVAVRSVGKSTSCAAAMTPEPVPTPVQSEGPADHAELARLLTQLSAASRAEESAKLAAVLVSVARWCPRRPTEAERFVLSETASPTVVLSLPVADAGALLTRIQDAVERWVALERK